MENSKKVMIVALIVSFMGAILIQVYLVGTREPFFPHAPNPKNYYIKEWNVRYYYSHTTNETIKFSLNEGLMEITLSNLNISLRYEAGEIQISCVGVMWGMILDESILNVSIYVFEWEPHGDVNHQYGVGFRCWDHPIGWIYPYFEEV